jgi:hypothetical protein
MGLDDAQVTIRLVLAVEANIVEGQIQGSGCLLP